MKKKHIATFLMAISVLPTWAFGGKLLHNYSYYARAGYNLGGTAPIGMPATIRSLKDRKAHV